MCKITAKGCNYSHLLPLFFTIFRPPRHYLPDGGNAGDGAFYRLCYPKSQKKPRRDAKKRGYAQGVWQNNRIFAYLYLLDKR